ncbi:MAG: arginine--tRNA ligase [Ardenticatenaceae bacterium]|nr:arginine--tRNA ligase [Ardenticatenaceae bacterium]MCB8989297.1 arginine--tRNA ligase [Ardenticatenaceae bacterium]
MQSLTQHLTTLLSDTFAAAGYDRSYGEVVVSNRPDLGQFQCNGALPAAKAYGQKPRDIAQQIVERLPQSADIFADISLAGPGFINLTLTDAFLGQWLQTMADNPRLGVAAVTTPQRVVVDYGGANVAKPMHVGHLRAGIIGESIKRLFRFMGDDVIGDVHLGDWGTQMGMIIVELAHRHPDWPYFDTDNTGPFPAESPITLTDLEEVYPAASARAKSDPTVMEAARQATMELQNGHPGYRALWQHFVDVSVAGLREDYGALDIHFDLWLGESDANDHVEEMIARLQAQGYTSESQGALIMDISLPDDNEPMPPLILRKSDGAVMYGTTDLATIDLRVQELRAQLILYVVDHRQQQHFKQVFRAAYKSGITPPQVGLEHNYFGTMNGKDGKPFKTRAGGVMKLKDLIQLVIEAALARMAESHVADEYEEAERLEIARRVGLAALKYADLMNQRTKDYIFDLDRFSSFEGRTGPYLLYTTVRARSILTKAAAQGLEPGALLPPTVDAERTLLLQLAQLPDALRMAYETRMPNHMADYIYTLANEFNRFYNACHILSATDTAVQSSWLGITQLFARVSELVLMLLGIEIPERM